MRLSSFLAPPRLGNKVRSASGAMLPHVAPPARVLEEKLRFLYQHLLTGTLLNLVASLALAFSLYPSAHKAVLFPWFGATLAITILRLINVRAYRHHPHPQAHLNRWRRWIEYTALAHGLLWGVGSTLMFPGSSVSQFLLISVLVGATGGAIIFLAPLWSAYVLFLVPTMVPLALRMLVLGSPVERTMGALGLVYTGAMVMASGRTCRWLEDALLGSIAKDALTEDLMAVNEALEQARNQLETTVLTRTLELSKTNLLLQAESRSQEAERLKATQAEQRYRSLFDAMTEGFAHVDGHEVFLLANPAAELIFGVPRNSLVGRNLKEFLAPEDIKNIEQETGRRQRGESSSYLVDILRADGAHRSLSLNVSPVWSPQGEYVGASAVFQDITEKKMNDETLRQAQKLESMGLLAGGIAHDFNNLLSAIMGNLNLLQLETPSGSRSMQLLATMETATSRAANLTKQMLAYSGRGRFQVRELNLNETIQDLTELFQVGILKGANLTMDLAERLPRIAADPSQMQQLLMNLMTNAAEALEGGHGEIHLSTRLVDLDAPGAARASVQAPVAPGPHVLLQVQDNGSGIAPEVLPHIFDPFFTTRESGRGLGLSAMLGILRGHGAGIEIKSRPGLGSTFTMYFPVAAAAAAAQPPASKAVVRPFRGKVLAVDDEPAVLETVTIMLERMGFEVMVARDGLEALECFRANADGIGLVLLDLTMPRMDGQEAFLAIRGLKAHVPMILSSGYDWQQTMHSLQGPGAPTFLQKPYTLKVLRKTIETALGA